MTDTKVARNWAAVTGIGTAVALFTFWLPWIFVPVEVQMKREGLQELEFPEMRSLLTPFSTMETGLHGAIDVGMMIPSWIFILLIVLAGLITIFTVLKIFEISHWIAIGLLALAGAFLAYWVGSAIAEGSKMQAGFPVAAVAWATILLASIKDHQRENKRMESNS